MSDINSQLNDIALEIREGPEEGPEEELEEESEEESEGEPEEGPEEESEEGPEEESEEVGSPTSVTSLAAAIGWTPEELYDIDVGMGEGKDPVKLGKLKDNYENSVKAEAASAADVVRLQGELTSALGAGGPQQISNELMNAQAQVLSIQQQYNGYNWVKAEQDDPGEAALLKQKFNEAFNQANGAVQQQQQLQHQHQQQRLQQGAKELKGLIPSWSDAAVMQVEQAAIKELMSEAGYPSQFIESIDDPIAISLLRELVQLREEKKTATLNIKKVRKAPIRIKGGKKVPSTNAKSLADRARRTGDKGDQLAAVKALLN